MTVAPIASDGSAFCGMDIDSERGDAQAVMAQSHVSCRATEQEQLQEQVAEVAAAWFADRRFQVEPWAAAGSCADDGGRAQAGFSGAPLARVTSPHGTFVLKAFATTMPRERASWIHALVRHVARAGIREVPPLRLTSSGETLVADREGRLWEMTRFVPGAAVAAPTPEQAAAALSAVAHLHLAAATLSGTRLVVAVPAAVSRRQERARTLLEHPWHARRAAVEARPGDESLLMRWDRAIAAFAESAGARSLTRVAAFECGRLPVQPVVRDLWSAHVLFASEDERGAATVSGIVDFHSAAIDTPATDCARLLGSWWPGADAPTQTAHMESGLEAYDRVRRLAAVERGLVPFLAATGVVFGLDNWFRWTLEERLVFPFRKAVESRIDTLLAALPAALQALPVMPLPAKARASGAGEAV